MSKELTEVQAKLANSYQEFLHERRAPAWMASDEATKLSAPFLIDPSAVDAYFKASCKIMFVGQETKGWCGKLQALLKETDLMEILFARYAKALVSPGRSSFLQMRRRMEVELADGIAGSVVWNNLFKMDVNRGKNRTRNARDYSDALTEFSADLFRLEFDLLRPKVVIFACSVTHDGMIRKVFDKELLEGSIPLVKRELWYFRYRGSHCFRTFHPAVARWKKGAAVKAHYETIIDAVRQIKAGKYRDWEGEPSANSAAVGGSMPQV